MLFFSAAVGKTASQFRVQRCQKFFNSDYFLFAVIRQQSAAGSKMEIPTSHKSTCRPL